MILKELQIEPTWITDDHVVHQSERGSLRHYMPDEVRVILEHLADGQHITPDMDASAIDTWLEVCNYGVWSSLVEFTRAYADDHHQSVATWSDCILVGFSAVKIKIGFWVYRSDVPNER